MGHYYFDDGDEVMCVYCQAPEGTETDCVSTLQAERKAAKERKAECYDSQCDCPRPHAV